MENQLQTQQHNYEQTDEISLRELLEILWNGKWIIFLVTAILVVTTGIFSFLVISPTYEAYTALMINAQYNQQVPVADNAFDAMVGSLSQYPVMSNQTYLQQVTSPVVLQQVIAKLQLEGLTPSALKEKISVELVDGTNIMRIKVKDHDPQLAAQIANQLSKEFVTFVSEKTEEQMIKSAEVLEDQLLKEQEKVDKYVGDLKEFLKQPQSVTEIEQEIAARLEQITEQKKRLTDLEVEIGSYEAAIAQAEHILQNTPKVLETKKSLAEDSYLHSIVSEKTERPQSETGSITMSSEEINSVYLDIQADIAQKSIFLAQLQGEKSSIMVKIKENQSKLEELQAIYAEKSMAYDKIDQKVKNAKDTYNLFLKKYEEALITGTAKIGENNVMLITPAMVPENPVAPKKILNVAISGVLGLMLSGFYVLFRQYWKNS